MNAHEVIFYVFCVIGVIGAVILVQAFVKAVKTDEWTAFLLKLLFIPTMLYFGLMIAMLSVPDGTTWP